MPDIVSRIRVIISGDARGLTAATTAADRGIGGTVKNLAIAGAGLLAAKQTFDFLGDSLVEVDRLEDATTRLELQLGDLAKPVELVAGDFLELGQSRQDILELAASFADIGTKAGIADPILSANADDVAAIAAAASLLGDSDAATIVEQIGKGAAGATKPLAELGVNIDETEVVARALAATGKDTASALTDGELAAARLSLILEQLRPKLEEVDAATDDAEKTSRAYQARIETLSAALGEKLAPAQETVLGFLNDEIDAIPHAIEGFEMLGGVIEGFARNVLGPLGNVRDVLEDIANLVNGPASTAGFDQRDIGRRERNTVRDQQDFDERNGGSRTVNNRIGGP